MQVVARALNYDVAVIITRYFCVSAMSDCVWFYDDDRTPEIYCHYKRTFDRIRAHDQVVSKCKLYWYHTDRYYFDACLSNSQWLNQLVVGGVGITKVSLIINAYGRDLDVLCKPFYFLKAGLVYVDLPAIPLHQVRSVGILAFRVEAERTDFVHVRSQLSDDVPDWDLDATMDNFHVIADGKHTSHVTFKGHSLVLW